MKKITILLLFLTTSSCYHTSEYKSYWMNETYHAHYTTETTVSASSSQSSSIASSSATPIIEIPTPPPLLPLRPEPCNPYSLPIFDPAPKRPGPPAPSAISNQGKAVQELVVQYIQDLEAHIKNMEAELAASVRDYRRRCGY